MTVYAQLRNGVLTEVDEINTDFNVPTRQWPMHAWLGYVDNSFCPHMVVVYAETYEDAYANLRCVESIVSQCEIAERDFEDYDPESIRWSEEGIPLDTEALQLIGPVKVVGGYKLTLFPHRFDSSVYSGEVF